MQSKSCPRCSTSFHCNSEDIKNCDCSKINLSIHTQNYLKETAYNCLCNSCLTELNDLVNSNYQNRNKLNPADLKEGTHFYKEGNFFVFTELYHYLKGTCCGNKCRHCAYGLASRGL